MFIPRFTRILRHFCSCNQYPKIVKSEGVSGVMVIIERNRHSDPSSKPTILPPSLCKKWGRLGFLTGQQVGQRLTFNSNLLNLPKN